ncbi:TPA: hypothetical protein ACP62B_004830, partial [Escherichia coli]
MSDISGVLNIDMQSRINSYRELARKAVRTDDSSKGAVAALERFFHKLEFLLKEGYLPEDKDVNGYRLPAELQGLKDFLDKRQAGTSYSLQRNKTEGYSFSWQGDQVLSVTQVKLKTGEAQAITNLPNCSLLQKLLGEFDPAPETPSVTDLVEPVVIDDTCSSAGHVDTTATPDSPEAASPSVASAAPQSLQQATRADQNKAEQTAPAEQPEVTGAEAQKVKIETQKVEIETKKAEIEAKKAEIEAKIQPEKDEIDA